MAGMVTVYKYTALPVPPPEGVNELELAPEGTDAAETPAQRFARQLSEAAMRGQAVQILQFPGFVLLGEIAGFMTVEQTVMPGIVPPGTDLRGGGDKGRRGH